MPTRSPASILFIDDDDASRGATAEVLRQAGFDIWEAPSGAEGLSRVRDRPDLVLLDVSLPDLSGFEVCRRIRADPDTASTPLLHLSGVAAGSEDRTPGLEDGADGYLLKPVEPAELVAHVRALLRLRRAEEALRESEERYQLIAESASAAIFVIDERSNVVFANQAAELVFGYPVEELLDRSLAMLMPPTLRGRHHDAVGRYLASGLRNIRWEGVEVTGLHRGGREIDLEVSFGEFRDREGRRRFVGVALDVSERKGAQRSLAALSRRLLGAQEAERRRIAHELHDEVGQALTALKITLHALRPPADPAALALKEAVGLVDTIMQQVRTLSLELRPPMMDDLGLVPALRWHAGGVAERTGLAVRLEADSWPGRLPAEVEMACFRVAQEALNNVVKHARARNAWVELRHEGGVLELTIRDDGVGFDAAATRGRGVLGASFGLLGMEERVVLLGGQFGIHSGPGEGTVIRARFPGEVTAPPSPHKETR